MFQQIIIIGHLGNEPEMRYTNTGVPVSSFSVATSKSWTAADGQHQTKTVWFRVSAWNKQAEVCAQYLHKGSKVQVVGEIEEPRVFTDRDGNARSSLEMRANNVTFLDSKSDNADGPPRPTAQPSATAAAPARQEPLEDIPF
jgi:single-strand DNA-binding protein